MAYNIPGKSDLVTNQANPEATVNTNELADDKALTEVMSINCAGGVDVTPNATTAGQAAFLTLTGLVTASINLVLPSAKHLFLIQNATTGGFSITVKCGAGTTLATVSGQTVFVYCDGSNVVGAPLFSGVIQQSPNGGQWVSGVNEELMTLSTGGATTDSAANLLPANSILEAVVARVTTTITTATDWKLGDATTAGRFSAANSTLTAGTTQVGTVHADQTGAAGPRQVAAAKLRITTTGTPGAGAIRVAVFYRQFIPQTT